MWCGKKLGIQGSGFSFWLDPQQCIPTGNNGPQLPPLWRRWTWTFLRFSRNPAVLQFLFMDCEFIFQVQRQTGVPSSQLPGLGGVGSVALDMLCLATSLSDFHLPSSIRASAAFQAHFLWLPSWPGSAESWARAMAATRISGRCSLIAIQENSRLNC